MSSETTFDAFVAATGFVFPPITTECTATPTHAVEATPVDFLQTMFYAAPPEPEDCFDEADMSMAAMHTQMPTSYPLLSSLPNLVHAPFSPSKYSPTTPVLSMMANTMQHSFMPTNPQSPPAPEPTPNATTNMIPVFPYFTGGRPAKEQRKHACTLCPQTFGRAHDLKRHMEGTHLGNKKFVCKRCGRSFLRRDALIRHDRGVRAGRRIKCAPLSLADRENFKSTTMDTSSDAASSTPGSATTSLHSTPQLSSNIMTSVSPVDMVVPQESEGYEEQLTLNRRGSTASVSSVSSSGFSTFSPSFDSPSLLTQRLSIVSNVSNDSLASLQAEMARGQIKEDVWL